MEIKSVRCYREEPIIRSADLLQETPVNISMSYPF